MLLLATQFSVYKCLQISAASISTFVVPSVL